LALVLRFPRFPCFLVFLRLLRLTQATVSIVAYALLCLLVWAVPQSSLWSQTSQTPSPAASPAASDFRPPYNARIDSLKQALTTVASDTERVMLLCELAVEYYNIDAERTKDYGQQASALAERAQFQRGVAQSAWVTGLYYYQQNFYDRAMQKFVEAAQRFERLGLVGDAGRAYTNIGNVHLRNAQYERALGYYDKAMAIAEQLHDTLRIAVNLSTRAQVYRKHFHDYDRAVVDLKKAIQLFSAVGNLLRVGGNHSIVGDVLADRGDHRQALDEYLKALVLRRQLSDNLGLTETLMGIAECYNALHRPNEALPYIQESVMLAERLGSLHITAATLETLAATHAALGQYQEAYRYRTRAADLNDTVFAKQRSEAIAEMQARYDLDQKNAQLRLQQAEVARQMFLRNVFVVGAVLLALVAAWMWWLYRSKHRAEREASRQRERAEAHAAELLHTNQALAVSNERLKELDNEKNEFLGIAVHDLKNPLASIVLSVDLLRRGLQGSKFDKVVEYSDTIRTTAERMMEIISNLLDLNRIEHGGWSVHLRPVELELIEALVEMYQPRARAKQITLTMEYHIPTSLRASADELPMILADYEALRHVVDNIVSNAVKYSPCGKRVVVRVRAIGEVESQAESQAEGHLSLDIGRSLGTLSSGSSARASHLSLDIGRSLDEATNVPMTNAQFTNAQATTPPSTTHFIRIEVQDEGPGLSEADKAKLFGKFTRLSARPTGGEHSTGLGLSIVKKLVEAMNGRVWCESELGKSIPGATFIVELPIAQAASFEY
jgi:signal transduction histidine kinase